MGQVIWHDDSLFARGDHSYGYGASEAIDFMAEFATGDWACNPNTSYPLMKMPGIQRSWRERRLPVNVDPLQSRLENEEERARLGKIFHQGLNKVAGYVLPLAPAHGEGPGWRTGSWFLRSQHLFFCPAIRPSACVCPLDRLPMGFAIDAPAMNPPDPMMPLGPFAPPRQRSEIDNNLRVSALRLRCQRIGGLNLFNPPTGLFARRYASSRGRGGSSFSCRRWHRRKITWI